MILMNFYSKIKFYSERRLSFIRRFHLTANRIGSVDTVKLYTKIFVITQNVTIENRLIAPTLIE